MGRRKTPTFEEMMEELSGIVDAIGRDDCPVDELDERVRRAAELIRTLRSRLEATEVSVREILGGLADETRGVSGPGKTRAGGLSGGACGTADDGEEEED